MLNPMSVSKWGFWVYEQDNGSPPASEKSWKDVVGVKGAGTKDDFIHE
jgi:hypothetical protein